MSSIELIAQRAQRARPQPRLDLVPVALGDFAQRRLAADPLDLGERIGANINVAADALGLVAGLRRGPVGKSPITIERSTPSLLRR